jgi:hypothetical protein
MAVRVDQSGHESLASDVDDFPLARIASGSLHGNDSVALDNNNRIVEVFSAHAVEDFRIYECCSIHAPPTCLTAPVENLI